MKVFFDNCTSPILATTLDGYIRHFEHSAHHIRDLPCGRDATDLEWITMLAEDSALWVVVTGDARLLRNPAGRAAYRAADLCGFVLSRGYQTTPMHQCASLLLWRWPEIEQLANLVAGPALYELPINRRSKVRQSPV